MTERRELAKCGYLLFLDHAAHSDSLTSVGRANAAALHAALLAGDLDGHEGRFVYVANGALYSTTYLSVHHFASDPAWCDAGAGGCFYLLPDVQIFASASNNQTSEYRHAYGAVTGQFTEAKVNIEVSCAGAVSTTSASLLDTGATFTDYPCSRGERENGSTKYIFAPPSLVAEKTMKITIPCDTGGGTIVQQLLVCKKPNFFDIAVGDNPPVQLTTLSVPAPRTDPQPKTILGRDIIFKFFELNTKKELRGLVNVRLVPREAITPPGLPPSEVDDALSEAARVVSGGVRTVVEGSMAIGSKIGGFLRGGSTK